MVSGGLRRWAVFCLCLSLLCGVLASTASAEEEVRSVSGALAWVSEDAVEIGSTRGLLTSESSVFSRGREVSIGSLRRGMPATMELDAAGRVLELRVKGVIE